MFVKKTVLVMSLMIEVSKHTGRDGRLIISAILGVTCLAFSPRPLPSLSNRACHASYPRSGPNPAVRSQLGREKFARAMKVLREEESVRARKGVSYMAVFQCNIDIYFE